MCASETEISPCVTHLLPVCIVEFVCECSDGVSELQGVRVSLRQRTSQTLELCRQAMQFFLSLLQLQLTEHITHTHRYFVYLLKLTMTVIYISDTMSAAFPVCLRAGCFTCFRQIIFFTYITMA